VAILGDEIKQRPALELVAELNLDADPGAPILLRLFLDGIKLQEEAGQRLVHAVQRPGAYRIEVVVLTPSLPWGKAERGFIYSNPIYVVP
jgi:hypothetical protein